MNRWFTVKDGRIDNIRLSQEQPGPEWLKAPAGFDGRHGEIVAENFNGDFKRLVKPLADNRGRYYSVDNPTEYMDVNDYGIDAPKAETHTTLVPPEEYPLWNRSARRWEVDTDKKELDTLEREKNELESEITSRDWKIIKAQRVKKDVEDLYPGETEWYNATIVRIKEKESKIAALKKAQ